MDDSTAEDPGFQASLEATLRLALVAGVGPRIRQQLLLQFGSAESVLSASRQQLEQVPGVGRTVSRSICAATTEIDVAAEIELCRRHRISILVDSDRAYPRLLQEIADPPGVLFTFGEIQPADALAMAIVGTRHATRYGLQQAQRLAAGLAHAGLTIVSGLARGIDAAAHRGALEAGGRTLAVLGSGILNLYPPEHKQLAGDIANRGALISEAPPLRAPFSGAFPQRNRLISGLSLGVIVVEAAERSGALISARHAMEQNREVLALPGRIDSRASAGCHCLIRDGATLVRSVDDVLEQLGPLVEATADASGRAVHSAAELRLNDQERRVLDAIDQQPTSVDQIVSDSGLPVHRVLSTISVLEMRYLIRRISGNQVARV